MNRRNTMLNLFEEVIDFYTQQWSAVVEAVTFDAKWASKELLK